MTLAKLTLTDVVRGIAAGDFTATAYAADLLAHIDRYDDGVKAWAWLDREHVMAEAGAADAAGLRGDTLGPLHGVPVGVKDIIFTNQLPTQMGSPMFEAYRPSVSAVCVDRFRQAGAYVFGKTTTTEFAWIRPTPTANPWNPGHTPGGSSSGSAAAVSAGFVPAALGTQTMGSVVRPASFVGVVGFKPSFGLISTHFVHPLSHSLDHIGIFARSVADAGLMAASMAGYDRDYRFSLNDPDLVRRLHAIKPVTTPPRFAAVKTIFWDRVDAEMRANFAANLATLRQAGAQIDEVDLPDLVNEAHATMLSILRYEGRATYEPLRTEHPGKSSPQLDQLIDEGKEVSREEYEAAVTRRVAIREALDGFMSSYDGILTVPATGEAPEGLGWTGDARLCATWTLCGVPSMNLPSGFSAKGLPLGLQLVGAYRKDDHALAVGQWCEALLSFPRWNPNFA